MSRVASRFAFVGLGIRDWRSRNWEILAFFQIIQRASKTFLCDDCVREKREKEWSRRQVEF